MICVKVLNLLNCLFVFYIRICLILMQITFSSDFRRVVSLYFDKSYDVAIHRKVALLDHELFLQRLRLTKLCLTRDLSVLLHDDHIQK